MLCIKNIKREMDERLHRPFPNKGDQKNLEETLLFVDFS